MRRLRLSLLVVLALAGSTRLRAEAPRAAKHADRTVRVGTTGALSGPSAFLGRDVVAGIRSYRPRAGHVTLELHSLDDGYRPDLAGANMRVLVDELKVDVVLGNVGTPTAMRTAPIAYQQGVLMLAPVTGAERILRRDPKPGSYPPGPRCERADGIAGDRRVVFNYRASYRQEAEVIIEHLMAQGIGPLEVGFVVQDDCYGDEVWRAGIDALAKRGLHAKRNRPALGLFRRNQTAATDTVLQVLNGARRPRALVMAGSYGLTAELIKVIRRADPRMLFASVSFVDSDRLLQALGPTPTGALVTQVVPSPDGDTAIAAEFRRDLAERAGRGAGELAPTRAAFEGYIGAKLLGCVLDAATTQLELDGLTRAEVLRAFQQVERVDIGLQAPLSFDRDTRGFSQHVWLTRHVRGGFEEIGVDGQPIRVGREPEVAEAGQRVCTASFRKPTLGTPAF